MYRLSHRNIGLLICYYRGSLILGIMHVYLTAHMREGIEHVPALQAALPVVAALLTVPSECGVAWGPARIGGIHYI